MKLEINQGYTMMHGQPIIKIFSSSSPYIMEPKCVFMGSRLPSICPYTEPDQSSRFL
jgi:hypothetical protein